MAVALIHAAEPRRPFIHRGPTVPTDRSDLQAVLVETARILARGGQLEEKLDALAKQAARVTGAPIAVVYLLDPGAGALVPAGGFGLGEAELLAAGVALDSADPVAAAARQRQTVVTDGEALASSAIAGVRAGVATLACSALVADEVPGTPEIQGVLAVGFEAPVDDAMELDDLMGAMADLAAVIIRDARLEQALLERSDWLERMANTDALTGLANRRTFERMLDLEVARAGRQSSPISVVLFDIDDLSGIAEREGAGAGDDVLRLVAATLSESVRLVDTVARVGADEFAVIAPGTGGDVVAQRIATAVARIETAAGTPVTVSTGLSAFPPDGETADALLASARAAVGTGRAAAG
jgi:diguanylate cyclase (GGDEF)-like protein